MNNTLKHLYISLLKHKLKPVDQKIEYKKHFPPPGTGNYCCIRLKLEKVPYRTTARYKDVYLKEENKNGNRNIK